MVGQTTFSKAQLESIVLDSVFLDIHPGVNLGVESEDIPTSKPGSDNRISMAL